MRAVEVGDLGLVEMAGGALTPLAWHRAFPDEVDLFEAVAAMERASRRKGAAIPSLTVLRVAYALAWTADYAAGRQTPPFERWLASAGAVNVATLVSEVDGEVVAGLLRGEDAQEKA